MMKWVKIIGMIFGLICIIAIGAIACLYFLLDPNQLKPTIINEVRKHTGYELTIDGSLSWSLFPEMSLSADHMVLAESAQQKPFLELAHVKMSTRLKDWWQHRRPRQGELTIKDIKWAQIKLQDASLTLHWQGQVIQLKPFKATFYEGKLNADLVGTMRSQLPEWDVQWRMEQVNTQTLFADLNQQHPTPFGLSGRMDATSHLTTSGRNKADLIGQLRGTLDLKLKNGIIRGIDLNYLMQIANALINKQPLPSGSQLFQTQVDNIVGSFLIREGIASTDHLLLSAPQFAAKMDGTINLNNRVLDLHLQVAPVQTTKPWLIPVKITGDWARPTAELDMLSLESLIAREKFEKLKEKVQQEIKELPRKANEFLKKILQ